MAILRAPSLLLREAYIVVASAKAALYAALPSNLSLLIFACSQFAWAGVWISFRFRGGGGPAALSSIPLRA